MPGSHLVSRQGIVRFFRQSLRELRLRQAPRGTASQRPHHNGPSFWRIPLQEFDVGVPLLGVIQGEREEDLPQRIHFQLSAPVLSEWIEFQPLWSALAVVGQHTSPKCQTRFQRPVVWQLPLGSWQQSRVPAWTCVLDSSSEPGFDCATAQSSPLACIFSLLSVISHQHALAKKKDNQSPYLALSGAGPSAFFVTASRPSRTRHRRHGLSILRAITLGALTLSATTGSAHIACPVCLWRKYWRKGVQLDYHLPIDHDTGRCCVSSGKKQLNVATIVRVARGAVSSWSSVRSSIGTCAWWMTGAALPSFTPRQQYPSICCV